MRAARSNSVGTGLAETAKSTAIAAPIANEAQVLMTAAPMASRSASRPSSAPEADHAPRHRHGNDQLGVADQVAPAPGEGQAHHPHGAGVEDRGRKGLAVSAELAASAVGHAMIGTNARNTSVRSRTRRSIARTAPIIP